MSSNQNSNNLNARIHNLITSIDGGQDTPTASQNSHPQLNSLLEQKLRQSPNMQRRLAKDNTQKKGLPGKHQLGSIINESKQKTIVDMGMVQIKRVQNFSYATSDQIGIGFSSKVYKGKNDKTNQLVAIKVIDLKTVGDELHSQFLNQEVATLQKIKNGKHQNLLRLEGVFKTKNNLYIVSQFCEGKDLGKVLKKNKKLKQQQAQSVMKQLLNGYDQLYQIGIVHRDLKPANLFVRKGIVKIADFGFAISAQKCEQKFNYNVGSPYYMPPQSLKSNRYSFKSDIWALGVIAYQLVHGNAPWKDRNDSILYQKITLVPIEQLIDPELHLSENYKNFIKKCLTIDFDSRANPDLVLSWPWSKARSLVNGIQQKNTSTQHNILQHAHSKSQIPTHKQTENQPALPPSRETTIQYQRRGEGYKNDSVKQIIGKNSQKYTLQVMIEVQQTLLAQLHYCRFLNNLHQEIDAHQRNGLSPALIKHQSQTIHLRGENVEVNLQHLKLPIAQRILNKIQVLAQIARTGQNILKIIGFQQYVETPNWQKLKKVIARYRKKYQQMFGSSIKSQSKSNKIISLEMSEQFLVSTIRALKATLSAHIDSVRLLELLIFYYQILGLEKKNNPSRFSQLARMDYLGSKKFYQNIEVERLLKKLQYMGI